MAREFWKIYSDFLVGWRAEFSKVQEGTFRYIPGKAVFQRSHSINDVRWDLNHLTGTS